MGDRSRWCAAMWGLASLGGLASCEASPSAFGPGLDLQVRVAGAQLQRGGLAEDAGGPAVSQVLRPQPTVLRGEAGVELDGRLGPGGVALHIKAEGDDDHWLVAPDGFDFVIADELLWDAQLEFSHRIAGERVDVQLQAVDARGRAGPVETIDFTILPDIPPAQLLISLGWDSPVDLDLHVELPDGTIVGPKNTNSLEPPPAGQIPPPDAWMEGGVYDYDSNQQCRLDLRNRENVVWVQPPPAGRYRIFAHLFSPCEKPAVNLEVMVMLGSEVLDVAGSTLHAFDARTHPGNTDPPGLRMLEVEIP